MTEPNNEYKKLQARLSKLGMVVPGTIRKVYLRCGKEGCSCSSGEKKHAHGPYMFWDRKVDGKLSSQSIAPENVALLEEWIRNRRTLEQTVAKLLALGGATAARLKRK